MPLTNFTRYELPPEGITLLGYIVRRMHKTELLTDALQALLAGQTAQALEQVSLYAAAASTSFGPAFYQPTFNRVGETMREPDPQTGAETSATLEASSPHYHITACVNLPGGETLRANETITGTTIGFRGLGMPAPSRFTYQAGDYAVTLSGLITSELALSFFRQTRIRAYGSLKFSDNRNNTGQLTIQRDGQVEICINQNPPTQHSLLGLVWHGAPQLNFTPGLP